MENPDNKTAHPASSKKNNVKVQTAKTFILPFTFCLLPLLTPFTPTASASLSLPSAFAQIREAPDAQSEQLLDRGVEQLDANQLDAALQSFQQILDIERQTGNRFGEAVALNNLGIAYYYKGQDEQAIASYREAMQIFWKLYDAPNGDSATSGPGIATSLSNQSIVYLQRGEYQKAIELCHGAIAIFRNMGDRTREAATLNNMGIAYEMLEDYERAIGYFQEALVTAQDVGDARTQGVILNNLEEAYTKLGQVENAKEVEQQALAIAQQTGEEGNPGGPLSSNDYLLLRQKGRSLALVFSQIL